MPVDPSWLPSTVAQSTAALVGIIGGLLVARFMSIDSEQKSLQAREAEADERLKFVTGVRDNLRRIRRRETAIEVLSTRRAVQTLLTPPPDRTVTAAEFLDTIGEDGWSPEEFEPYLDEARAVVRACGREIIDSVKAENGERQRWQPLRRQLELAEDEWDDLREEMHDHLKNRKKQLERAEAEREREEAAKRRSAKNPFGIDLPNYVLRAPILPTSDFSSIAATLPASTFNATARTAEAQRMRAAEDDVVRAQFEHDIAARAVKNSALPSSLMAAVWMLIGLTAVGLVLPVIALFAMPSYGTEIWRLTVLLAFCVGITGLLIYLYFNATRLGPKQPEKPEADKVN